MIRLSSKSGIGAPRRPKGLLLLSCLAVSALAAPGCGRGSGTLLNDVHSRLNATRVSDVLYPESTAEVQIIVMDAIKRGRAISISGGRHSMGGQQFGRNTVHISTHALTDVLEFDQEKGLVRVESGLEWPRLLQYLNDAQEKTWPQWSIRQKPTGADKISLGGALSSNVHGRGLHFKPIIQDVEAFKLVDAEGNVLNVSRSENSELFRLAIGGYGLFGVITEVTLRLQPRTKLRRSVELVGIDALPRKVRERLDGGALYGDYQYKIDPAAEDFMQTGILSTYSPVSVITPIPKNRIRLSPEDWHELLLLAHTDKAEAFRRYSEHYLKTNGQVYWSDYQQLTYYDDQYENYLKAHLPDYREGSLMITEVYVPLDRVREFVVGMTEAARANKMNIIYGTMRLIKRDDESFLAWAKRDYACIIFNLRVEHSKEGIAKARRDFQLIIDKALAVEGSYYLTYHRWARKDQVLAAYPQFVDFLKLKLKYDPEERFQSEWYRHYRKLFSRELRT